MLIEGKDIDHLGANALRGVPGDERFATADHAIATVELGGWEERHYREKGWL